MISLQVPCLHLVTKFNQTFTGNVYYFANMSMSFLKSRMIKTGLADVKYVCIWQINTHAQTRRDVSSNYLTWSMAP